MKKTNKLLSLALTISLLAGCAPTTNKQAQYSTLITMDVNPSIQFELDDDDKVLKVLGNNAEAKTILEGMDLTHAQAKVAVNAVLGSLVKEGYLNVDNNTVLLSVENDDQQKRESLEKELSDEIHLALKDYQIDGAILSNDLDIDDDIQLLTDKYDISYGKAALIEEILDENDDKKSYKVEDLVKLNAQELILIYQEVEKDDKQVNMTGSVSQSGYLSKDDALAIVLKDAGLEKSQIKNLEIDYDMENGVLTYEIEFDYNSREYDYEVSVEKGIIEKDVDFDDDQVSVNKPSTNNQTSNQTNTSSKKYSKDQALALVLKDAGLSKSDIRDLEIELDDGTVYEIDFDYSNKEYSYDVHVTKGIIDKDIDIDDDKKTTSTTTQTSTKKYTKDQALALALKDAGLSKSEISRLEIELDDGTVYEIDFDSGNKEYSYDVHVSKGIVDKEIEKRD